MINFIKKNFTEDFFFLSILSLTLYLQHSSVVGFFSDGYLYSAFGKNAAELGKWLVPHLSEATYSEFFHHLPFVFILEGLFFKVVGHGETAARVFASSFSFLSMSCVYFFLSYFKEKKWAFLSSLIFILIFPLIKKTRFPNLDLPLMLFFTLSCFSGYLAILQKKNNLWYFCGLFFGVALLTKGPIGVLIPLSLLIFLLLDKNIKILKSIHPWLSLLMGLGIFMIWPLCLYLSGKFHIFISWSDMTFIHTIKNSRNGEDNNTNLFTYGVFLLKEVNIWFLIFLFSIRKFFKKNNSLYNFSFAIFCGIFFPLSLAKFKYSHYLIPLYPALAICAGGVFKDISDSKFLKLKNFMKFFAPTLCLVLLIFPITNKSKRDVPIHKMVEISKHLSKKPNAWVNINGVYPFFALANLLAYKEGINTINGNVQDLERWLQDKKLNSSYKTAKRYFLISKSDYQDVLRRNNDKLTGLLRPIIYSHQKSMYLLVPKNMLNSNLLYQF